MNQLSCRVSVLCLSMLLVACSDSDNNSENAIDTSNTSNTPPLTNPADSTEDAGGSDEAGRTFNTVQLNATAGGFGIASDDPANRYTYFNLARGEVVELSDAEAIVSNDWHLGFKRTQVIANGGLSGSGEVSVALADAALEHYNADGSANASVFLNDSAEAALARFNAVEQRDDWSFSQDNERSAINNSGDEDSWWQYDFRTHTLSARDNNYFIVRGAAGEAFTLFRVTSLDTQARQASFEMQHQQAGESSFSQVATWQATVPAEGLHACFDIQQSQQVDCDTAGAEWDLRLSLPESGRGAWTLWTNGGVVGEGQDGAAFGPIKPEERDSYVSAPEAFAFSADAVSGVFKDHPFYAYNLQASHKLWPNYRVYAVDLGSAVYKVQITSYYDPDTGTSGTYTLRYAAFE